MVAFANQFGLSGHPTPGSSMLDPILLIVISAIVGGVMIVIAERVIPPARRAIRSRLRRGRRLRAAATAEIRSRAQMDELCPYGWQAQITIYSSADDMPPDAPDPDHARVALEWAAFGPDASAETVVVRRLWAESVGLALEAMVADRITDETLQDIEARALADGADWND